MAFTEKTTGSAQIPVFIQIAKNLKYMISEKDVIGCVAENIDCDDDDDDVTSITTEDMLKSARLLDDDGVSVKRPSNVPQKSKEISMAII